MLCLIPFEVNSVLLGLEVQYTSSNLQPNLSFMLGSVLFGVWFIFEVFVRMYHAGPIQFFMNDSRWWNICDLFLMGVSVLDICLLLLGGASTSLSSLKILKMIRVVRLFRVFRFFQQLATLALMVAESVKQLLWALSMFVLIMYIFAITLTSSCTDWLKSQVDFSKPDWEWDVANTSQPGVKEVHHFFGSLPRSGYTLIQTTLGGISWHEVTDSLLYVDAISFCLMFAYLVFTILALLNVFTGLAVQQQSISLCPVFLDRLGHWWQVFLWTMLSRTPKSNARSRLKFVCNSSCVSAVGGLLSPSPMVPCFLVALRSSKQQSVAGLRVFTLRSNERSLCDNAQTGNRDCCFFREQYESVEVVMLIAPYLPRLAMGD